MNRAPRIASALRLLRLSAGLLVSLTACGLTAFAADAGTVTGSVTSTGTRNALQGALVSIPALNRSALTDEAGQFTLINVPAGTAELVVSYAGFEDSRQRVSVSSGSTAGIDFALKSADVVTMQAFTVESVREGQALALTRQRNAADIKNVTAFDEWGVLPTQNVGELMTRLPGIAVAQMDEDGLIMSVSIGGQPGGNAGYTRMNIDGMASTGVRRRRPHRDHALVLRLDVRAGRNHRRRNAEQARRFAGRPDRLHHRFAAGDGGPPPRRLHHEHALVPDVLPPQRHAR
jgi:hypothetical protein